MCAWMPVSASVTRQVCVALAASPCPPDAVYTHCLKGDPCCLTRRPSLNALLSAVQKLAARAMLEVQRDQVYLALAYELVQIDAALGPVSPMPRPDLLLRLLFQQDRPDVLQELLDGAVHLSPACSWVWRLFKQAAAELLPLVLHQRLLRESLQHPAVGLEQRHWGAVVASLSQLTGRLDWQTDLGLDDNDAVRLHFHVAHRHRAGWNIAIPDAADLHAVEISHADWWAAMKAISCPLQAGYMTVTQDQIETLPWYLLLKVLWHGRNRHQPKRSRLALPSREAMVATLNIFWDTGECAALAAMPCVSVLQNPLRAIGLAADETTVSGTLVHLSRSNSC